MLKKAREEKVKRGGGSLNKLLTIVQTVTHRFASSFENRSKARFTAERIRGATPP